MKCGMWNARNLYMSGSLMTIAKELSKYKLGLVGVQEVRQGKGGTKSAQKYTFLSGKGNENHKLCPGFICTKEDHVSN